MSTMGTRRRTLYLLGIILASALAYLAWDLKRAHNPTLVSIAGRAERAEISFGEHRAEMRFDGKHWEMTEMDDRPLCDKRVNEPFLEHILDLVHTLHDQRSEQIDPADAASYGMAKPTLAVSLGYKDQEDAVLFGHRDLTNKNAFAFFVKNNLVTLVSAGALDLITGKSAMDLSGSRLSMSSVDDIMELSISGTNCKPLHIKRDGDGWTENGKRLPAQKVDAWLKRTFGALVEPIALANPPTLKPVCTVSITTVTRAKETISIQPGDYVDAGKSCVRSSPGITDAIDRRE